METGRPLASQPQAAPTGQDVRLPPRPTAPTPGASFLVRLGPPDTCLRQLGPQLGHVALQATLVAEGGSQLCLTPVEQGLQILHAALGHRELALPLLGAASQERVLARSRRGGPSWGQGAPQAAHSGPEPQVSAPGSWSPGSRHKRYPFFKAALHSRAPPANRDKPQTPQEESFSVILGIWGQGKDHLGENVLKN